MSLKMEEAGKLAAELQVTTADHAHYTSDDARAAMSEAGVNCGFLPGTPYSIAHCLDNEWVWTIASDFNPNCRTLSFTIYFIHFGST